ncbi:MAG: tRNA preQ1(34) S-adenosylmethionine ribosyltransferase-isomerase QueA [Planctomycetes bacterium]|nr:tRNA preQ1(34) S-adenosylmethionine ribosyltransferase-isomerase QueA [Planctomycetota bacterium]
MACVDDLDLHAADSYAYDLPADLIAQEPLADRAAARLLVVNRADGGLGHRSIRDLPSLLARGDLVVVNDTKVVPARLVGHRAKTGGTWEGLFLRVETGGACPGAWVVLAQTRGRPEIGERIVLTGRDGAEGQSLELLGRAAGGAWLVRPLGDAATEAAETVLARVGRVPLPGYIRGGVEHDGDLARYQTVFAREAGSAAAPTAGLHFTPEIFADLAGRGVERAAVTLHVGLGTFRPITADTLDGHVMHSEWCTCPAETVEAVQRTKARGGRVVAVGTTAVRTLETAALAGTLSPWSGATELFIKPGFPFRVVDALLTNFHMPRTTLMVLVSALASRDLVMRAYAEAIRERYRMLSYGDAMLIL